MSLDNVEFVDLEEQLKGFALGLEELPKNKRNLARAAAASWKFILTDYAQEHRHWQDRSTMARVTLETYISNGAEFDLPIRENSFYVVLTHGAIEPRTGRKYGFDLETMQGGRFGILDEAIEVAGVQLVDAISHQLGF